MAQVEVPPLNFTVVAPNVYRSGYPNKKNFGFLKKLKLKSITYLCEDDYQAENIEFLDSEDIRVFQFRLAGNKEPFVEMDQSIVANVLQIILDTRNHPILVHCNKGKHRVGTVFGCLRKLQRWGLASIFDEYRRISGAKNRHADLEYIEVFSAPVKPDVNYLPDWISPEILMLDPKKDCNQPQ